MLLLGKCETCHGEIQFEAQHENAIAICPSCCHQTTLRSMKKNIPKPPPLPRIRNTDTSKMRALLKIAYNGGAIVLVMAAFIALGLVAMKAFGLSKKSTFSRTQLAIDPNKPYPNAQIEISSKAVRVKNTNKHDWPAWRLRIDEDHEVSFAAMKPGEVKIISPEQITNGEGKFTPVEGEKHNVILEVEGFNPLYEICFVAPQFYRR